MSLRNRFGRFLGRSSDGGPRASEEHPITTHSQVDSRLDPASELRREPPLSPRKLHKAASTTFQAFSDSLRSRAQAFYASPGPEDVHLVGSPEPKIPKVSPRRTAIWPSVRGRENRSAHERQSSLEPESEIPVPSESSSIGPAPRLDMDFPNSSLRDPNEDDNVTTPSAASSRTVSAFLTPVPASTACLKPHKQWPSPHMHLRSLSLVKTTASSPIITPAGTDEGQPTIAGREDISDISDNLKTSETGIEAAGIIPEEIDDHIVKAKQFSEDTGYASDTESNTGTITTRPSTAATSVSRPLSLIENPHVSSRLFEGGAQSNEDFQGTFWPACKVLKSSKRSSPASTINEEILVGVHEHMDRSMGSTVARASSALSFEQVPEHEVFTCTPLFHTPRVTSDSYEADTEADPKSSQTASMGSRELWAEARDDRAKRYAALRSEETNMDTSTDEDSDFGVELTTLPSLDHGPELSGKATIEQVNPICELAAPQKHLGARSLHLDSLANLSEASKELDADMSPSSKNDCSGDVPHDGPHNTHEAPVIPLGEYMADKNLRLKLLDGNDDFILEETPGNQGTSTATDRFLITSRLDLEDPFEAAVASFGGPDWAPGESPGESQRKSVAENPAWCAHDPISSIPIPLPSMHAHTHRPHQPPGGLLKRMGQSLMSKQGDREENGETSPVQSTSSASTDNWEQPTVRYGADSTLGRSIAQDSAEPNRRSLRVLLVPCTSERSASGESEASRTRDWEEPVIWYNADSVVGRAIVQRLMVGTSTQSVSNESERSSSPPPSPYGWECPSDYDDADPTALTSENLASHLSELSIPQSEGSCTHSELMERPDDYLDRIVHETVVARLMEGTSTRSTSLESEITSDSEDSITPPVLTDRPTNTRDVAQSASALETLMSCPYEPSISSQSDISSVSEDSNSPFLERGRQRGRGNSSRRLSSSVRRPGLDLTRSSLRITERGDSSALDTLPSSGYRRYSQMRCSTSERRNRSPSFSYASCSRNGSFEQTRWLEAHYRMLEQQIAQDTARNNPQEPRQRLADVSMVERSQELNTITSYEALCQFIYRCERESEAEEAKEEAEEAKAEAEKANKEAEEAKEDQDQYEEGYTSAMFQGT